MRKGRQIAKPTDCHFANYLAELFAQYLAQMASLAVMDDLISFQEKEREISPAMNMRAFSKLVARLLFREYHFKNGF
jgi:hypothetical protein